MSKRILWIFNHTSLRKFELPLLVQMGYEVYCPKIFDVGFGDRSASVTWEYDSTLSVPRDVIDKLNQTNFYQPISTDVMDILNQYFETIFCMAVKEPLHSALYHFKGRIVLHVFGLSESLSYSSVVEELLGPQGMMQVSRLGSRFWFGQTYDNLDQIEPDFLKGRSVYLPIGLTSSIQDSWEGGDPRFLFVSPKIKTNSYYREVYQQFCSDFGDLPHVTGGGQIIPVPEDPTVTGFLSWEEYVYNMTHLCGMYYHSQNPRHLHYHPLEAIQYGMPLIFMAGGMLDHLGGEHLPGRCRTVAEARRKLQRLSSEDRKLAEEIRESQRCLLEPFTKEYCLPFWEKAMRQIESVPAAQEEQETKKLAVVLPAAYTGGIFDYAYRFCRCLQEECKKKGDPVIITFAYPDDPVFENNRIIQDLKKEGVATCSYRAEIVDGDFIHRERVIQGIEKEDRKNPAYVQECIFRDGKYDFTGYDYAFVMSDASPCDAPIYWSIPHAVVAHDYIQHYVPHLISPRANQIKLENQRRADYVLVTSEPTKQDAMTYAGIEKEKIRLTPYLLEFCQSTGADHLEKETSFFLWSTNASRHKNHLRALEAISDYYENGGRLDCLMTGSNTKYFREDVDLENAPVDVPYVKKVREMIRSHRLLQKHLHICGNLAKGEYISTLQRAEFVFHPGYGDNGNGSVFDAAGLQVPALVSDYPAMRYMGTFMKIPLWFFDPYDTVSMEAALQEMAENAQERKKQIPQADVLRQADYRERGRELYQGIKDMI